MAIIGVLNTLIQADTSAFDKGMKKVSGGVSDLSENVRAHSTGISESLNAMGQLSGLGGGISGAIGKVTTFANQVKTIVAGTSAVFNSLAFKIVEPFTSVGSMLGGVALNIGKVLATGIIIGLASIVTTAIPEVLGFFVSAGVGAVTALVRGWMALVGPFFSFAFNLISTLAGMLTNTISSAFNAVVNGMFGAAANATTFVGGLLANIPTGGLLIVIGLITTIVTAIGAVAAAVLGLGVLSVIPAAFTTAFAGLGATLLFMLPALAEVGVGVAALIATLSAGVATIGLVTGGLLAAAAAAVGFTVKLWSMASAGAKAIETIYDLANNLDLASSALVAFSMAPGVNGIEGIGNSMFRLQSSLENISPAARDALRSMQVDLNDLSGASGAEQIRMLADGYLRLEGQAARAGAARAIFGRGGMGMMDILEQGAEGLDRLTERAERFGLMFTESQAGAIRRANFEWRGFSQAMEGIERQSAIMFAPLWEWLGKIGGQIGEYVVGQFKTFTEFVKVATPDIQRVFTRLWDSIQEGVSALSQMFQDATAEWGLSFNSMADVGLVALAAVVVAFEEIDTTWDLVKTSLQIGWLTFLNFLKTPLISAVAGILGVWDSLPMAWQVLTGTIKRAFLVLLRDTLRETAIWANSILIYTDPRRLADAARNALANGESVHAYLAHRSRREVEAAAGGLLGDLNRMVSNLDNLGEVGSRQIAANIRARQAELSGEMSEQLRGVAQHMPDMIALALNSAAEAIGPGWLSGIDEQLEELTDHWETAMGFMGMNVQGMADRWRAALRSVSNEAQQTANTAARQSITMTRAVTGHEAALEGGEKAFSLLFGSSSNQNFYQKATMEAVRRGNVDLGAIRRAFEQAPPIRRARI